MINKLLRHLTHKIWNQEISRILCRTYQTGTINSSQLHTLSSKFDPTQDHEVR